MLLIYIDNQLADTEGLSFTWTRKSPIMNIDGDIEADYIYNLSFKNTDINKLLFETPLRFSRVGRKAEFDVRCIHFGTELFTGSCKVESSSEKVITTSVRTGSGSFAYELEEKKLNDDIYEVFPICENVDSAAVVLHAKTVVLFPELRPYCFPKLLAEEFYDGINSDFGGDAGSGTTGKYLNNWSHDNQEFSINIPTEDPWSQNVYSLLPLVNLHYVLGKIFDNLGFKALGKFFDDPDYKKLVVANNTPLDYAGIERYFVRASNNASQSINGYNKHILFQDDSSDDNVDLDDCFDNSNYTVAIAGYYQVKIHLEIEFINELSIGMYFVNHLVRQLCSAGFLAPSDGVHIVEKECLAFVASGEIGDILRVNLSCDDEVIIHNAWITYENVSLLTLNSFSPEVDIKKHLPALELKKFLGPLFYRFGMAPFVDNEKREIELIYFTDIINDPEYIEFSDKITQLPELKKNEITGLKLTSDVPGVDKDDYVNISNREYVGSFTGLIDLPEVPPTGSVALVKSNQSYYEFIFDMDNEKMAWVFLSRKTQTFETGKDPKDIKKDISVPFQSQDTLFPDFKQKANSEFFKTENDSELQILYYHGMVPDENWNYYPMASAMNHDCQSQELTTKNLSMPEENGIIENHLQSWINHKINTSPVSIKKLMTSRQIKHLKLQKKIRIDGIEYLIIAIKAPISDKYLIEAELDLETV